MTNKISAVDWLIKQVESKEWQDRFIWHKEEIFKQAKQLEKEQLFEFWNGGIKSTEEAGKSFDQYINTNGLSINEILSYKTPIELPSDDEIKEAVENKFGLVDPILGKSDYRMGYESGLIKGVKWMKEKILNQNK